MRSKDNSLLERIKGFVEEYCDEYGYGPSTREVASIMGIGNGTASRYMQALLREGVLVKGRVGYESLSFSSGNKGVKSLPIFLNGVPCGPLSDIDGKIEGYIKLPEALTGKGDFFILRASGSSMVDAGIEDGDYVLIRQQNRAEVGEIIVALIDNNVTLKRLKYNSLRQEYYLHPENKEMSDIYANEIAVQGVAIKVIKSLI